jgi:hypothetical protein
MKTGGGRVGMLRYEDMGGEVESSDMKKWGGRGGILRYED